MVSARLPARAWHVIVNARPEEPPQDAAACRPKDGGVMKHKTSAALYEYWLSCHADRTVRAGGISALTLAPLLPDIFLLDLAPEQDSCFRFCGAALASRYGRDLTGESFLALWSPDDRRSLTRDLRAMGSRSTGMVAGVMGETMGGGFIAYEMLLLPLVGEHGGAGALGSMVRIGGHDEQNRIRGRLVAQALRSIRFLPAAEPVGGCVSAALVTPLAQDALREPRRYGHLTVVSGGK
jgi:hypothetical protein